jgi:hypothetical protein
MHTMQCTALDGGASYPAAAVADGVDGGRRAAAADVDDQQGEVRRGLLKLYYIKLYYIMEYNKI